MRGDLSETTLPAICRSLASDGATGRLVLDSTDGPSLISLSGGSISDARSPRPRARLADRLTGGGHLDELTLARVLHELRETQPATGASPGQVSEVALARALLEQGHADPTAVEEIMVGQVVDALVELSGRRTGPYRFLPPEPGVGRRIGGAVLLDMEVALTLLRRRGEAINELPRATLRPDAVPYLLFEGSVPGDRLDADAVTVIAAIDDDRSVRELAELLGYGSYDLATILADLYGQGIVALTHPRDDIGAALDLALRSGAVGASSEEETAESPDSGTWRRDRDGSHLTAPRERARDGDAVQRATVADWVFEEPEAAGPVVDSAAPDPATPDPATDDPATDDGTPAGPGQADPVLPDPAPPADHVDHEDTDVSEFLRELSALALGDAAPAKGRHNTSSGKSLSTRPGGESATPGDAPAADTHDEEASPPAPQGPLPKPPATKPTDEAASGRDSSRKRRKGLFGRG